MASIYFVRHAQSLSNASGEEIEWEKNLLTEDGRKQARVLGDFFRNQGISFRRAYHSHYPRAIATAKIILERLQANVDIFEDPRIREREKGELAGVTPKEIWKRYKHAIKHGSTKSYEFDFYRDEDTSAAFIQNQRSFLKELLDKVRADLNLKSVESFNTLIISHGNALKGLMDGIIDGIFSDLIIHQGGHGFESLTEFPWAKMNTAVTKVSVRLSPITSEPAVMTFHKINSVDHLALL